MTDAQDSMTQELPVVEPRWLALLRQAVAADARGCSGVAANLKKDGGTYSRMYVSQFLNGLNVKPASPAFQQSVVAAYGGGRLDCPFLATDIAPGECADYAGRSYGAITAADVPHWRACQACPKNPLKAKP